MPLINILFMIVLGSSSEPMQLTRYKLLYLKNTAFASGTHVNCAISVDQCGSDAELQNLVCNVIKNEGLSDFYSLGIEIFYKLERYDLLIPDTDAKKVDSRHLIAVYVWKADNLNSPGRLIILNDPACPVKSGARREIEFNHVGGCKKLSPCIRG